MNAKPAQVQQRQPGLQSEMRPDPQVKPRFPGSGRLAGKTAIVTGGDSGIGQAVAVLFAREGANVAILYLDETEDARKAARMVRDEGGECLAIAGDVGDEQFCSKAVQHVVDRFGGVDVLVNNAAEQHPREDITEISREQLERTFRTNIFGYFFLTQSALPHMREGARSSTPRPSPHTAAADSCWTTARPRARSSPLPARWRNRSWNARFASTAWHPVRYGPLSSRRPSMRRRSRASARTCRWADRASPTRSRRVICFWPAKILRT